MTEPAEPVTFEQQARDIALGAAQNLLATVPEVDLVVIAIGYKPQYAGAEIQKIVWLGRHGAVVEASWIIRSIQLLMWALEQMYIRLTKRVQTDHQAVADLMLKEIQLRESTQREGFAGGDTAAIAHVGTGGGGAGDSPHL